MTSSQAAYLGLLALISVWRLVELAISRRNLAWARERGGVETGQGHFPAMVVLHAGLIVGSAVEVLALHRPFVPALGWPLVGVLGLTQALRLWCMAVLGRAWNTRVVVVPGAARVRRGPYRVLTHPNYLVVVVEGLAIPLVHTAVLTAVVFTVANGVLLLRFRIPAEDAALAQLTAPPSPAGTAHSVSPR